MTPAEREALIVEYASADQTHCPSGGHAPAHQYRNARSHECRRAGSARRGRQIRTGAWREVQDLRRSPRSAAPFSTACAISTGLRVRSARRARTSKESMRSWARSSAVRRPTKKCLKRLARTSNDFHALVDQLHGLTIGSFEEPSDESEEARTRSTTTPMTEPTIPTLKFETNELTDMSGRGDRRSARTGTHGSVAVLLRRIHDEGNRDAARRQRISRVAASHESHTAAAIEARQGCS